MNDVWRDDPEVAAAIACEQRRQRDKIELIASENYTSPAVLAAVGSVLTNKYAEGYPGRRYYGGCECVDQVEQLAIDRAKRLFGAEHVNVQPHSGASANLAAFMAVMEPGDTFLGLSLEQGGHLTHGLSVNFSGRLFEARHYGLDPQTELIDYDGVARLAREVRPKLIVCGASAYSRVIDFRRFREIADEVGALLLADIAHIAGLVAAGVHPSPFPHAHIVTTTTHKTLRGPRGGMILCTEALGKQIDKTLFPGFQGGPLMHVIAGKAVAFGEALRPEFRDYAEQVVGNARALASALEAQGLRIVSGGTDTHLMLVDLTSVGISGRQAQNLLDDVGITLNKNTIPGETRPPTQTSGIRIGTPAVTTRGFGRAEMVAIAELIARTLHDRRDEQVKEEVRAAVREICRRFPVPGVTTPVETPAG